MSHSALREYIYPPVPRTFLKRPSRRPFNILGRYARNLNFGLIQTKHAKQRRSCQGQLLPPQVRLALRKEAVRSTNVVLVSRTPTVATLKTASEASLQSPPVAELSGTPPVPPIPNSVGHKRQKSSISSLCRSLLKVLPISLPLSADPQIRALAEADPRRDIEQQAQSDEVIVKQEQTGQSPTTSPTQNPSPSSTPDQRSEMEAQSKRPSRSRSMTATSDDAPEVVAPPATVHRSNTSNTLPGYQSQSQPPAYMLIPPNQIARRPMDRPPNRRVSLIEPNTVARRHTHRFFTQRQGQGQGQGPIYQFEPSQIPRHTQSHHHRPHHHSPQSFEQYRSMGPGPAWRRNDVEIIYPSTRRSRSSTCGGLASFGHGLGSLDSIRETGSSVDEARAASSVTLDGHGRRTILDGNMYRGANRTSMYGFS
jgi:hypothetical protein